MVIISLACKECKRRNYTKSKNRANKTKLALKKYCKWCRKHTLHNEGKI